MTVRGADMIRHDPCRGCGYFPYGHADDCPVKAEMLAQTEAFFTALTTEPAPAGDHSSSSAAEPGKGKAEAGVGLTASASEQLKALGADAQEIIDILVVGETDPFADSGYGYEHMGDMARDVRPLCERIVALAATASDLPDPAGGLSVEKPLRDALERERKARKAAEELNAEEVLRLRTNLYARIESLEAEVAALASVGVRPDGLCKCFAACGDTGGEEGTCKNLPRGPEPPLVEFTTIHRSDAPPDASVGVRPPDEEKDQGGSRP